MNCVRCLGPIDGIEAIRVSSPMMVRLSIHLLCLIELYDEAVYTYPNEPNFRQRTDRARKNWRQRKGRREARDKAALTSPPPLPPRGPDGRFVSEKVTT